MLFTSLGYSNKLQLEFVWSQDFEEDMKIQEESSQEDHKKQSIS